MILSLILPLIGDSLHDEPTVKPSCYGLIFNRVVVYAL